jgi:hypothetical protein
MSWGYLVDLALSGQLGAILLVGLFWLGHQIWLKINKRT